MNPFSTYGIEGWIFVKMRKIQLLTIYGNYFISTRNVFMLIM